jgi:hypothetical protein
VDVVSLLRMMHLHEECGLGISYVYGLKKISVFDPSGTHVLKDIYVYLVEKSY